MRTRIISLLFFLTWYLSLVTAQVSEEAPIKWLNPVIPNEPAHGGTTSGSRSVAKVGFFIREATFPPKRNPDVIGTFGRTSTANHLQDRMSLKNKNSPIQNARSTSPSRDPVRDNGVDRLTISVSPEMLIYKEHESDTFTDSRAIVVNPTIHLGWSGQYGPIIGGLKGSFPVFPTEDIEKWDSYGIKPYQSDVFKYEWKRADAYLGYFLAPAERRLSGIFYLGLRNSYQKQTRDDFIQQGVRLPGRSVEEVKSYGLLIGLMSNNLAVGESQPDHVGTVSRWSWSYALEFVAPLSVKTTNTTYPGVEFNDEQGYTYEIRLGAGYRLTRSWVFEGTLYGGRMHWAGSNWKTTSYGRLKWPENNTDYLGINLALAAYF